MPAVALERMLIGMIVCKADKIINSVTEMAYDLANTFPSLRGIQPEDVMAIHAHQIQINSAEWVKCLALVESKHPMVARVLASIKDLPDDRKRRMGIKLEKKNNGEEEWMNNGEEAWMNQETVFPVYKRKSNKFER